MFKEKKEKDIATLSSLENKELQSDSNTNPAGEKANAGETVNAQTYRTEKKKAKKSKEKKNNEGKKKGNKKIMIILIVITVFLIIGLIISFINSAEKTAAKGMPVSAKQALKGDIVQKVEVTGTVSSEESKTYFADCGATISHLNVKAGQVVKAGDLLVEYDTTDLENQQKQADYNTKIAEYSSDISITATNDAQAKAAQAAKDYDEDSKYVDHYAACVADGKAQLAKAGELAEKQKNLAAQADELTKTIQSETSEKKIKKAQKKLDDVQKQLKDVTKELKNYDVDSIQNAIDVCAEDLADYKAKMAENEAKKETDPTAGLSKSQQVLSKEAEQFTNSLSKEKLEKAKEGVKADFNGVVSEVSAVEGQMAADGVQLFTIQNADKVMVSLSITKYDIEKVKEGQKAVVTINGEEYQGHVSYVSHMARTSETGAKVVDAEVHIDNPDENIVLSTEAKVKIETAEEKGALLIPISCVNYASDGVFCYKVVDGKVEKTTVETGISSDEYIQVLSGVKEGDELITDVTTELEDGTAVMIMPDENEDALADETQEQQADNQE